jgi:hypothetical protein
MTSDVEELLRESMDRLAAGARVPAGLTRRARQRNRQRRRVITAAAVAGTAIAATAAVIAVTVAPQRSSDAPREQTIAYVTSRAQHALAVVAQRKAIEEVLATAHHSAFGFTVINMALSEQQNPTGSAILPGVLKDVKAQRTTSWIYRGLFLQEGFSASGKLVFSSSLGTVTSPAGKPVLETYGAAYSVGTRWRAPITGTNGPAPKLTCLHAFPVQATPNLRATISKALSCKLFALDGHQEVNGVNAIKLVMKPQPGLPLRETLWVDPSDYLPLRASVSFLAAHGPGSLLVQDYRWLPPTRANLAALHAAIRRAAIPAGFRKLPSADLPMVAFDTP